MNEMTELARQIGALTEAVGTLKGAVERLDARVTDLTAQENMAKGRRHVVTALIASAASVVTAWAAGKLGLTQ